MKVVVDDSEPSGGDEKATAKVSNALLKELSPYIQSELNVEKIELSSSSTEKEAKVQLVAVLRTKKASTAKKVKKSGVNMEELVKKVSELTEADISKYEADGQKIELLGLGLDQNDLEVKRELVGMQSSTQEWNYSYDESGKNLVLLDFKSYPELEEKGLTREVANAVQKQAKDSGLAPTDVVEIQIFSGESKVSNALYNQKSYLESRLRRVVTLLPSNFVELESGGAENGGGNDPKKKVSKKEKEEQDLNLLKKAESEVKGQRLVISSQQVETSFEGNTAKNLLICICSKAGTRVLSDEKFLAACGGNEEVSKVARAALASFSSDEIQKKLNGDSLELDCQVGPANGGEVKRVVLKKGVEVEM